MDKDTVKHGLRLFVQLAVVTLLNFFICISMLFICTAVFTEDIGYSAVVYDAEGQEVERYTYLYEDGEDEKAAQYPEESYQISKQTLKSKLSSTGNAVFHAVTAVFSLMMLIGFVYPRLWQLGAKDSNLVRFKHRRSDPLRGLKIGLIAKIPGLLILLAFLIFGRSLAVNLYALLNSTYYALIDLFGNGKTFGELGVLPIIALFLLLLVAPAVAAAAYLLGLKDISLSERLIYSKKRETK